jgi:hypothetical protein
MRLNNRFGVHEEGTNITKWDKSIKLIWNLIHWMTSSKATQKPASAAWYSVLSSLNPLQSRPWIFCRMHLKKTSFHRTDSSPSCTHKSDSLPNFGVNKYGYFWRPSRAALDDAWDYSRRLQNYSDISWSTFQPRDASNIFEDFWLVVLGDAWGLLVVGGLPEKSGWIPEHAWEKKSS